MSRDEKAIEDEIQAKGLTAPRLTPADIDALIASEHCGRANELDWSYQTDLSTGNNPLGCLTICVLVLKNGFTVVGKSACASPENFDVELGRKIARDDARNQIWALEGYFLRSRLAGR